MHAWGSTKHLPDQMVVHDASFRADSRGSLRRARPTSVRCGGRESREKTAKTADTPGGEMAQTPKAMSKLPYRRRVCVFRSALR